MSGNTGTQSEVIYSLPLGTAITKNTYSTQAAFTGVQGTQAVCKLPASWLADDNPWPQGRLLQYDAMGTIANTSAATFAVALGFDVTAGTIANSITVYAATAPTASTTTLWHCHAKFICTAYAGSTASFQVNGFWTQSAAASGSALVATGLRMDFQGAITGFNPLVDNFIELFGTWSVSAAGNTTTVQQIQLLGLL